MSTRILVVDNEQRMCNLIKQSLEMDSYSVQTASSGNQALQLISQSAFDIIITDLKMTPVDGLAVLKYVKENKPEIEVILITAFASQETALKAMKAGAYDYIIKPFKMEELHIRIERILKQNELLKENEKLKSLNRIDDYPEGIIGKSRKMRDVYNLISRVAGQDATVLIRGESGTGKELVAKSIHQKSHRSMQNMITLNCAALPETLLESELFGHEKGAFTGANQQKKGMFEIADKGTLFLDEIGDLSPGLQAKLLRVLQNQEIIRLGGTQTIKVDVRLITATHQNLEKMIEGQKFRSDLYYRINLFPITLPALRERKEDIPELIEHFMKQYPQKVLSSKAKMTLMEYDFPGNVRELENIISRAAIVSENVINDVILPNVALSQPINDPGILPDEGIDIDKLTKSLIEQALERVAGNKTEAAQLLGISRRRLYSMMKTFKV
jgi:DNA-binding NtrC family response regulator